MLLFLLILLSLRLPTEGAYTEYHYKLTANGSSSDEHPIITEVITPLAPPESRRSGDALGTR